MAAAIAAWRRPIQAEEKRGEESSLALTSHQGERERERGRGWGCQIIAIDAFYGPSQLGIM